MIELSTASAVDADLVFLTVGGVQSFIAESRKTADAAGASLAVRQVVAAAASIVVTGLDGHGVPYGLVMPDPGVLADHGKSASGREEDRVPVGISNKVAFLAPVGCGVELVKNAAEAARAEWTRLVTEPYRAKMDTPGMPDLTWVCVKGAVAGDAYRELWRSAERVLRQRKRTRSFAVSRSATKTLCAQSPLLPAALPPPRGIPRHERGERLSAAGWIKRHVGNTIYGPGNRFPATTVVASSAFRARLVNKAVENTEFRRELIPLLTELVLVAPNVDEHARLRSDVPAELSALSTKLGSLISPHAWEPKALREAYGDDAVQHAERGRRIAAQIGALAQDDRYNVVPLTPYFAIVVQDLDKLGKTIGGLGLAEQREASRVLTELGRRQRILSEQAGHLGVPVFAGGDDFLAFAPASTALSLAVGLRRLTGEHLRSVESLKDVTASTAVVFSHMTSPLREAIATAQSALEQAKDALGAGHGQRNALSVVALRRGGERARTVQPWYPNAEQTTVDLLTDVAPDVHFSGRLAGRLEQDRGELNRLAADSRAEVRETALAEVRRLVRRQGGGTEVAEAVITLGRNERRPPDERPDFDPVPAMLVARFLSQECR